MGVDTFGFALPARSRSVIGARAQISYLGTDSQTASYSADLPGGGFVAWGKGGKAWVEASIPKRLDPDGQNVEPVGLGDVAGQYEAMLDEARQWVEWETVDPAAAKLVRVDVVRDFREVTRMGDLLDGLAWSPGRDKRHKVRRYADADRGRAETLRVGPKSWCGTLYDKCAETGGLAPMGSLRFEARARHELLTSEWAQERGLKMGTVAALFGNPAKVRGIGKAVFARCEYNRRVSSLSAMADAIWNLEDLKPAQKAVVWAALTAPTASFSRSSLYRYRPLLQKLGVTPAAEVLAGDLGYEAGEVSLDYLSGLQVAA
jgi:hypothetical protein